MGAMELGEFQPGRFHDIHDFLRILIHENSHAADQGGIQSRGAAAQCNADFRDER